MQGIFTLLSNRTTKVIVYLLPLIILCLFFLGSSFSKKLHDFSNSYFPAQLTYENTCSEILVFDIYDFNKYIWDKGYTDVLTDFYLNSPFTNTFFYPLGAINNAYVAKFIFNLISIILFLIAVFILFYNKIKNDFWILLLIPLVFLVPIRNQIVTGQSYFLVLFLVVFGYNNILKNKNLVGASALSLAVLIKIFPVFYCIPLLLNKKWLALKLGVVATVFFVLISIYVSNFSFWSTYLFEILPNAISNKSTIDFRVNYQSFDVLFKIIFVRDVYYNPEAIFNAPKMYILFSWVIKSFILGVTIKLSLIKRNDLFQLLAIWVVALFLLQGRTAIYAQILWIIPALVVYNSSMKLKMKILFGGILFVACNFPLNRLYDFPIFFQFSRLWLSIALAFIFYRSISGEFDLRYSLLALVVLLPFNLGLFKKSEAVKSEYVLKNKQYFMIYDFKEKDGKLIYSALGSNLSQSILTEVPINKFDTHSCTIKNNQIFVNGNQITSDNGLKKKPVLINDCDVYFLTDHFSRRGAYTLKKINICSTN